MTYDVFISYSRKDTVIADRICAAFDEAGITYFIDRQGIVGGMEFPKILAPAIKESEVFLLLASENAYQSPFTTREILYAFNKKRGEKMLPYIIDGSVLPDDVEFVFSSTNWRTMHEHPIDPVLVDDVLHLLGRQRRTRPAPPQYSQQELEEINRKGDEYYDAKQYEKAIECFNIAAEQGNAEAQCNLGVVYFTQEKFELAVHWFQKSANQNNARAQFYIGILYSRGLGVPKNLKEAFFWLNKAAELGSADAQYNLGIWYNVGFGGVEQDYDKAVRLYKKAAEQGHAGGQNNLAVLYDRGLGLPKDKKEAARLFKLSAGQGFVSAQRDLAKLYLFGDGITQDYKEALYWFKKAAEKEDAESQAFIGAMYMKGTGVPQDLKEARKWMQKAADNGFETAKKQLQNL